MSQSEPDSAEISLQKIANELERLVALLLPRCGVKIYDARTGDGMPLGRRCVRHLGHHDEHNPIYPL